MKVKITDLAIEMELKNPATFRVQNNKNETQGFFSIDKTHVIWRKAQQQPKNRTKITWEHFIKYMESL